MIPEASVVLLSQRDTLLRGSARVRKSLQLKQKHQNYAVVILLMPLLEHNTVERCAFDIQDKIREGNFLIAEICRQKVNLGDNISPCRESQESMDSDRIPAIDGSRRLGWCS